MHTVKTKRIIAILSILAVFSIFNVFPNLVSANDISVESIIRLINEARSKEGVPMLLENAVLDSVAKDKVRDMLENDYFAHNSPSGKDPWFWFAKNNYDYAYAGENLAINFKSAQTQHEALMKSESHKKNILNANYTQVGVAVAQGKIEGKETILVAQVFGSPMGGMFEQKNLIENGRVLPAEVAKGFVPLFREASFWERFDIFSREGMVLIFSLLLLLEIILVIKKEIKEGKEEIFVEALIISQLAKE